MRIAKELLGSDMGMKKWRTPDIQWLINVISSLDENHFIFDKNYQYKKSANNS